MASSNASVLLLMLVLFQFMANIVSAKSNLPPCPHHFRKLHARARINSCMSYLAADSLPPEKRLSKPSKACCNRYQEIFSSEDPTTLCIFMHPERVKTLVSLEKLVSLQDLCDSVPNVPLHDVCTGVDYGDRSFNILRGHTHGDTAEISRPRKQLFQFAYGFTP